jgi:hypothetical protein
MISDAANCIGVYQDPRFKGNLAVFTERQSAGRRSRFNGRCGKPPPSEPIDSGSDHSRWHNLKTLRRPREFIPKKIKPFNIAYVNFHCGRRDRLLECFMVEGVVPLNGSVIAGLAVEENFLLCFRSLTEVGATPV